MIPGVERTPCPACGGAGGGPFGPANSAWDDDEYVCPKCEGAGVIAMPGIVKAVPVVADESKKKATG